MYLDSLEAFIVKMDDMDRQRSTVGWPREREKVRKINQRALSMHMKLLEYVKSHQRKMTETICLRVRGNTQPRLPGTRWCVPNTIMDSM